ncbi:unnamed protein product [Closterium sp. Yama58-4]|nr:unnamed protein product [Closterium sp. Yama58-4]
MKPDDEFFKRKALNGKVRVSGASAAAEAGKPFPPATPRRSASIFPPTTQAASSPTVPVLQRASLRQSPPWRAGGSSICAPVSRSAPIDRSASVDCCAPIDRRAFIDHCAPVSRCVSADNCVPIDRCAPIAAIDQRIHPLEAQLRHQNPSHAGFTAEIARDEPEPRVDVRIMRGGGTAVVVRFGSESGTISSRDISDWTVEHDNPAPLPYIPGARTFSNPSCSQGEAAAAAVDTRYAAGAAARGAGFSEFRECDCGQEACRGNAGGRNVRGMMRSPPAPARSESGSNFGDCDSPTSATEKAALARKGSSGKQKRVGGKAARVGWVDKEGTRKWRKQGADVASDGGGADGEKNHQVQFAGALGYLGQQGADSLVTSHGLPLPPLTADQERDAVCGADGRCNGESVSDSAEEDDDSCDDAMSAYSACCEVQREEYKELITTDVASNALAGGGGCVCCRESPEELSEEAIRALRPDALLDYMSSRCLAFV